MAILGLRALYFVLAGMMSRFHYLDAGSRSSCSSSATKMVLSSFVKVPNLVSLGVIGGVLTLSVVFSLLRQPKGQSVSEAAIPPESPASTLPESGPPEIQASSSAADSAARSDQ